MPVSKPGSPSRFRSASTAGNGWPDTCKPLLSITYNCFPWISDLSKAQRLMDSQLKTPWPKLLDGIARQLNPMHTEIFPKYPISYYWSTYQHEWALDVVVHHAGDLRRFYPRWVNLAMTTFSSPDVMRFLGKPIALSGQLRQDFSGEVLSALRSTVAQLTPVTAQLTALAA